MKKIYTIILLFCLSVSAYPVSMDDYGEISDVKNRPGNPWTHSNAQVPHKKYTWHHMIPWNVLNGFWNKLVINLKNSNIENSALSDYKKLIKNYLELIDMTDADTVSTAIENANLQSTAAKKELMEKLCWSKWNLVEGPLSETRTEDPGEGFDNFSNVNSSLTVFADKASDLYKAMDKFNSLTGKIKGEDIKGIKSLVTQIKSSKGSLSNPFLYDASWWLIDGIPVNDTTKFCWRWKKNPEKPPGPKDTCATKKKNNYTHRKLSITVDVGQGNAVFFTGDCEELTSWGTGIHGNWIEGNVWVVTVKNPAKKCDWKIRKGKFYGEGDAWEKGPNHKDSDTNPAFQGWD